LIKTVSMKMKVLTTLVLFVNSVCAQIPNNGFESWQVDGNNDNNPVGWSTTNSDPDVSVSPYQPAYAGNYSMKVATFDPGFMALPGTAEFGFSYTQRPDYIRVCLKTNVIPGDKVTLLFALYKGQDTIVASPSNCSFNIDSTISNFMCIEFPLLYDNAYIPDSAYFMFMAGTGNSSLGTYLIVDELSFGWLADVSDFSVTNVELYPNPVSKSFTLNHFDSNQMDIKVYSQIGEEVDVNVFIESNIKINVDVSDLQKGLYSLHLINKQTGEICIKKCIIE
jgi:Secretion system C-terminal sorting domain